MATRGYTPVTHDKRKGGRVPPNVVEEIRAIASQIRELRKKLKSYPYSTQVKSRIITRTGAYK